MKELKERIVKEAKVLPGNIVKVDGFLNHRIDCDLLANIAHEFHNHFNFDQIDVILTAEASGIAVAAVCAALYHKPMIFAKKAKSGNIADDVYSSEIFSYTYQKKTHLMVSKEWLKPNSRVLIVDDFLAHGEALSGLSEIVKQAQAQLVGMGVVIEKGFQHGGDQLREKGIDVYSLAIIENAEAGNIIFR